MSNLALGGLRSDTLTAKLPREVAKQVREARNGALVLAATRGYYHTAKPELAWRAATTAPLPLLDCGKSRPYKPWA